MEETSERGRREKDGAEETRKDMQRYFMRKTSYAEDFYSGVYAANFST